MIQAPTPIPGLNFYADILASHMLRHDNLLWPTFGTLLEIFDYREGILPSELRCLLPRNLAVHKEYSFPCHLQLVLGINLREDMEKYHGNFVIFNAMPCHAM